MANREVINMILKNHLLDTIFPKVVKKYNDVLMKQYGAYMVIIGGVSVEMCARLDETAQQFLRNVFSEDIDIKVVIPDGQTVVPDKIHDIRVQFLSAVIKKLDKFIKSQRETWDQSIGVNAVLDTSLINHQLEAVANARVVSVVIEYTENKYRIKYPLLDTSFLSSKTTDHFAVYQRMMKSDYPVPFYTRNGINFATCEYMLYDNCRMLVDRAKYLREKKTLFALMKFTKYVIKFMSLYVLRKKLKKLPVELANIYEEAYGVLKNINTFKLKNGFKKMYKITYDDTYVNSIVSKLDVIIKASSMRGLIRAATKHSLTVKAQ